MKMQHCLCKHSCVDTVSKMYGNINVNNVIFIVASGS